MSTFQCGAQTKKRTHCKKLVRYKGLRCTLHRCLLIPTSIASEHSLLYYDQICARTAKKVYVIEKEVLVYRWEGMLTHTRYFVPIQDPTSLLQRYLPLSYLVTFILEYWLPELADPTTYRLKNQRLHRSDIYHSA